MKLKEAVQASRVFRPNVDALGAILPKDAAPQGVVAVEHEALAGLGQRGGHRGCERHREPGREGRAERDPRRVVGARVPVARHANTGDRVGKVEHGNRVPCRSEVGQRQVQAAGDLWPTVRIPCAARSEHVVHGGCEVGDDDGTVHTFDEPLQNRRDTGAQYLEEVVRRGEQGIARQLVRIPVHERDIGTRQVLPPPLAEPLRVGLVDVEVSQPKLRDETALNERHGDRGQRGLERRVAKHGNPQWAKALRERLDVEATRHPLNHRRERQIGDQARPGFADNRNKRGPVFRLRRPCETLGQDVAGGSVGHGVAQI